jgi:hypothetical protein
MLEAGRSVVVPCGRPLADVGGPTVAVCLLDWRAVTTFVAHNV